jgi:Domain of unknown function (DUF4160)
MPQISSFYGIIISFYFFDHYPPHFHAEYGEHEVLINIVDMSIYKGWLPPRAYALVMEWAIQHKDELLKEFEVARIGNTPAKIAPLK